MSNDLMFRTLSDAMERQEIVSIYTNYGNPGRCSAGRISKLTPTIIVLESVTPDGRSDGVLARLTDNIYKVERQGRYEGKLQFFHSLNTEPDSAQKAVRGKGQEITFESLLEIARSSDLIMSIWLSNESDEDYRSGFLHESDGNWATLRVIGDYGEDEGFVTFRLSDIVAIDLGGTNERALDMLYRSKTIQ